MKKIFTFFAALACAMSMFALTYNVTVPTGTKACYIAGEMNGWSQVEMTKVDDTHYTLDVADATEAMKYKYCSGPGWAYVEKTANGDEVADRTYSANDVVEKWASVYDPGNVPTPGETKDITVKAKVPAAWTETITAWVWPTGGAGKEVTPSKEGEWYVVTNNCAELNIIFKNGAGWNGDANQTVDMVFTENTCIEITAGSGKATYTVVDCEGGDNPGDDPVVTPATYYITGNDVLFGTKAWAADAVAMTENAGVYTHTFTNVAADAECQLKVTNGTWEQNWGYSALAEVPAGVTTNKDGNIIFTLAEAGDVVVTFSAEKITITGNFAGSSVDPAQITYVLMGVQGDWTTGIELTKNEGAEWEEYMLLGQPISEGDSVKVVRLEAGVATKWCGNVKEGVTVTITPDDKNGNIILAPGTYDFYYDVVADAIWIAEAAQSAVDNVVLENKATKIIRNGQMYIIRDEVMFNVLGQVVK